jgi:hypothetical protein
LSNIEYRTPAVYYATKTVFNRLEKQQDHFFRDLGITKEAALMDFNLAPLSMRRDIAVLGMLHRSAIGEGLAQFREYFKRRSGSSRLDDPLENQSPSKLMRRSIWGLVRVYNTLGGTLQCQTVQDFQKHLQERAKAVVTKQLLPDWSSLYSPR